MFYFRYVIFGFGDFILVYLDRRFVIEICCERMDRHLMELVKKHGQQRWTVIADYLQGRIGKQCRERWHNHLRPDIKVHTRANLFIYYKLFSLSNDHRWNR